MKEDNMQHGIRIFRPLINIVKNDIFSYAHKNNVPYFLNSTPEWSSRHILRSNVLPNLKKHFGNINDNMINFSRNVTDYIEMCNEMIINPYIKSLDRLTYYYRIVYNKSMNKEIIFNEIIIRIMHENGYNMISKKSLNGFINWLDNNIENQRHPNWQEYSWLQPRQYQLNKDFFVSYNKKNNNIYFMNYNKIKDDKNKIDFDKDFDFIPNKIKKLL